MRVWASSLLALALGAVPAGAADRTWRAEPSGVTFQLTTGDLSAWVGDPKGPAAFSTAALFEERKKKFDSDAEELARALLGPEPAHYADSTYTEAFGLEVLSVVGPLVVYRESGGGDTPGAAHPSRYVLLHAVDVRRKDATPSLLDFFAEKDLLAALKADPWVRKFDNGTGAFERAATLNDLAEALDADYAKGRVGEEEQCKFDAWFKAEELKQQFYFHHVAGSQVAVRILVPTWSEWCNRLGGEQEIGLLLPMPASLRDDLVKAQSGEAGLVGAHGKTAHVTWATSWQVDVEKLAKTLRAKKAKPRGGEDK